MSTHKREVERLIEALQDPEWEVRAEAASTLGAIEPEADAAVPELAAALKEGRV